MMQFFYSLAESSAQEIDLNNAVICCHGNSLTAGQGGTPFPAQLQLLAPFDSNGAIVTNRGIGGQDTDDMIANAPSTVDILIDNSVTNILVAWEIRNQFVVEQDTVSNTVDLFVDYCNQRISAGWDYIVVLSVMPSWTAEYKGSTTIVGYENLDQDRLDANIILREYTSPPWNKLCDVGAIDGISVLGDNEQAGYVFSSTRPTASANGNFVDGTHMSTQGYSMIADAVKSCILSL